MGANLHVLVIGHRPGLTKALHQIGAEIFVWNDKEILQRSVPLIGRYIADFEDNQTLAHLNKIAEIHGHFNFVIAGKESAVLPTQLAQTFFHTRNRTLNQVNRCRDKLEMKNFLKDFDISMTSFSSLENTDFEKLVTTFGLPLVMKQKCSSGSRGVHFCETRECFESYNSQDYYVEKFIDMEEASIESFIHNGEIIFTNITRYLRKKLINVVPANFYEGLANHILEVNKKVVDALGIEFGMTHLEVYFNQDHVLFGEIALRPPGGYIMDLIKKSYHFNPWELYCCCELGIDFPRPMNVHNISAVSIFHPGEGTVTKVEGLDQIKKLDFVQDVKCKIEVGQKISKREAVSEEGGHFFITAKTNKELEETIRSIDRYLQVKMS